MSRRKTVVSISIDGELLDAVDRMAEERGENRSKMIVTLIRLGAAMPLPEVDEDEERTLGPTRSERAVLEVLKSLGANRAHRVPELVDASGLTHGVLTRSLQALKRRGEAHLWGVAFRIFEGEELQSTNPVAVDETWSASSPAAAVQGLIDAWAAAKGETPLDQMKALNLLCVDVGELCLTIDDIEPIRDLVCAATGITREDRRVRSWKNTRDRQGLIRQQEAAAAAERERFRTAERVRWRRQEEEDERRYQASLEPLPPAT